jgi:hypothetical protein
MIKTAPPLLEGTSLVNAPKNCEHLEFSTQFLSLPRIKIKSGRSFVLSHGENPHAAHIEADPIPVTEHLCDRRHSGRKQRPIRIRIAFGDAAMNRSPQFCYNGNTPEASAAPPVAGALYSTADSQRTPAKLASYPRDVTEPLLDQPDNFVLLPEVQQPKAPTQREGFFQRISGTTTYLPRFDSGSVGFEDTEVYGVFGLLTLSTR